MSAFRGWQCTECDWYLLQPEDEPDLPDSDVPEACPNCGSEIIFLDED